jgi:hypothetical protein
MMDDKLYMFDGIVCICTTQEEDRWQKQCLPQFEKFDCVDKVHRVSVAPSSKSNFRGSTLGQYHAIQHCKESQYEFPLILESDFKFVTKNTDTAILRLPMSLDFLENSIASLKKVDWKIFSLGGKITTFYEKVDDYLIKASRELSHAYCLNGNKYYDDIIDTFETAGLKTPTDWIYSKSKFGDLYNYSYMTSRILVQQSGSAKAKWRSSLARKKFKNKVYKHLK